MPAESRDPLHTATATADAARADGIANPATPAPRTPLLRQWFADPRHGPLPVLLLLLTANTGVIDAVSILTLGRVFVANMTGNVVFVGFAVAGAPGFSLSASLWALAGFIIGAYVGGLLIRRIGRHRGRLFATATVVETVMIGAALIVSLAGGHTLSGAQNDLVAGAAAVGLGLQNAVVRRLAVPDLTTTVLTMTLTGIAADVTAADRVPTIIRRLLAVTTMILGAVVGALLVLHLGRSEGLGVAVALVAVTATAALISARGDQPWQSYSAAH
ncbi:MAG: hypothetical protein JWO63_1489 [Frankiales bacterium]|jgi:uncharacterized membrane protein YoaK (UPF0700 family)|nr:hypothetical protein [Frankiales bacterium]